MVHAATTKQKKKHIPSFGHSLFYFIFFVKVHQNKKDLSFFVFFFSLLYQLVPLGWRQEAATSASKRRHRSSDDDDDGGGGFSWQATKKYITRASSFYAAATKKKPQLAADKKNWPFHFIPFIFFGQGNSIQLYIFFEWPLTSLCLTSNKHMMMMYVVIRYPLPFQPQMTISLWSFCLTKKFFNVKLFFLFLKKLNLWLLLAHKNSKKKFFEQKRKYIIQMRIAWLSLTDWLTELALWWE